MKLAHLLDPRLVLMGKEYSNLDEALHSAVDAAADAYRSTIRRDEALARVMEREALGGTVLPTGVAIPHARLDAFDDLVIVPVVPRSPIQRGPGEPPIRLLWLLLTSKVGSPLYLTSLAAIASIAKDEGFLASLLNVDTPARFVSLVEEAGYEIKKGLRVEDIMARDVVSIRDNATLKDLIDIMYTRKLRYLPVVDDTGRLIGELGILDLISAGIPDYALRLTSLDFLDELAPMEELLARENEISVRSIMKPAVDPLSPSSSVFDAALRMTKRRKRHFPVTEGGRLVGVVSSMDILSKVLRS
ncbi:MAG: CBS domain-containing protein [Spirochaetales bacterium]|nr:MAG: CBS domain-containing protein [Spirochaetales bacterium]